jgi:hypothetical protein
MPLDSLGYQSDNCFFYKRAVWRYKFAWFPCKCDISKKRLWMKMSYKGMATYTGPGDPVYEYKWLSKEEFLILQLKGKI